RPRRALPAGAYEQLGQDGASGMAVALSSWADTSLAQLSPTERTVARRVFLRLVHLGEGRDDTRRQPAVNAPGGVSRRRPPPGGARDHPRRQQPVTALRVAGEDSALLDRVLGHLTERRL